MSTRQGNRRNQNNQKKNTGNGQQRITRSSSSSSSHQWKMTDHLRNIFDGEHQNFMYFHEFGSQERHIAVVFAYNYQTGRGDFTGAMWHYDTKTKAKGVGRPPSWDKAQHRQTALRRYELREHIHFQVPFNVCQDDFRPELRRVIRKTIRRQGLYGERLDLISGQPRREVQQPDMAIREMIPSQPASQAVLTQSAQSKRPRYAGSEPRVNWGEYLH